MDTRTSYLGMSLEHPFMAGASPFGYAVDTIKRLEDAGCSAVVLHSLFEEQISYAYAGHVAHINVFERDSAELLSTFPGPEEYPLGPDEYAAHIVRAKQAVRIPVIGSLNGRTPEDWLKFARVIEQAGADAIELNMYEVPTDLSVSSSAIEDRLVHAVKELKRRLKLPIAVKLSPFWTAPANLAHQLEKAGADGLVLFNRFYQPDIDIRTMSLKPKAELSTSAELLTRLRWVAVLHGRIRPSLAITGGVAMPDDGIKAVLAGADAVQIVSALLRHGPQHLGSMRRGLEQWMAWHHVDRLDDVRGALSLRGIADRGSFERAQYIRTLHSWLG
ncbi:MAG TPA: dihydroorotate dehydrogenase-like protein [Vicinamibacterales bacterium]